MRGLAYARLTSFLHYCLYLASLTLGQCVGSPMLGSPLILHYCLYLASLTLGQYVGSPMLGSPLILHYYVYLASLLLTSSWARLC